MFYWELSSQPQEVEPNEDIDRLVDQLEFLSSINEEGRPNAPDEYSQAFYASYKAKLQSDRYPLTRQIAINSFELNPGMLPAYFANANMRASQDYKLRRLNLYPNDPDGYPMHHDTPEAWDDFFEAIETDNDAAFEYWINLSFKVQSNIANRGQLPKVMNILSGHDSISVMDVGCSRNHVLKKLALENGINFRYDYTEVMRRDEDGSIVRDIGRTAAFNRMRRENPLELEFGVGVDAIDLRESQMKTWAESCSFYPSELIAQRKRLREYKWLDLITPESVHFYFGDYTEFDDEEYAQRFPNHQQVDEVWFLTMLHQQSKQNVKAMLDRGQQYARRFLWVVDFISDIGSDGEIEFAPKWNQWTYGVWGLDMARADKGFQKYLSVKTGRANQIIIEPAVGELAMASHLGLAP